MQYSRKKKKGVARKDKGESSGSETTLVGTTVNYGRKELKEVEGEKQGGGSFILEKWAAVPWRAGKAEEKCSVCFSSFVSVFT